MRIPGALAASIGETGRGTSFGVARRTDGAVTPQQEYGRAALDACARSDLLGGGCDQALEELVLTGEHTYFVLRVVPLDSGAGPAFLHMAFDRSRTNLALACMDIKALGGCIPSVVAVHGPDAFAIPSPTPQLPVQQSPGRHLPRREPPPKRTAAEPLAAPTDESLLQRVLTALQRLG
jgi:hypothetical protein